MGRILLPCILGFGLVLSSCRAEAKDLLLLWRDGRPLRLLTDSGRAVGDGGKVEVPAGDSIRFFFAEPLLITDDKSAFTIDAEPVSGFEGVSLDLVSGKGPVVSSALPFRGIHETKLQIPLPARKYSGFTLRNSDKNEKAVLRIGGLRIEDAEYSSTVSSDGISAFSGLLPEGNPGAGPVAFLLDTDGAPSKRASGLFLELGQPRKNAPRRSALILSNGSRKSVVDVARRPRGETLFFYFDALGFIPTRIEISENGLPLRLGLAFIDTKTRSDSPGPIPGDLETILSYPPAFWRQKKFEVFRWSLFPEVLVFDTADYAVQHSFFHRLAFFVEKKGFRGRLSPDGEIAERHGWNAHNYRAEDLASFFNEAEKKRFPLNMEERWLGAYLADKGILKKKGTVFSPGIGGILSVSRESLPAHRRLLITHEAFHGVYYGIPGYRQIVQETWDSLSAPEKDFWRYFLSWMQYEVKDPYLVVNEFQAYLLQQPLRAVDEYFKKIAIPRILEKNPERKELFEKVLSEHPALFTSPAGIFSEFLERNAGLRAGEVFSVFPRL